MVEHSADACTLNAIFMLNQCNMVWLKLQVQSHNWISTTFLCFQFHSVWVDLRAKSPPFKTPRNRIVTIPCDCNASNRACCVLVYVMDTPKMMWVFILSWTTYTDDLFIVIECCTLAHCFVLINVDWTCARCIVRQVLEWLQKL